MSHKGDDSGHRFYRVLLGSETRSQETIQLSWCSYFHDSAKRLDLDSGVSLWGGVKSTVSLLLDPLFTSSQFTSECLQYRCRIRT